MTASPAGIPLLDEDMMGRSTVGLGFPHLLLCMGLMLRTDKELYGVHLTAPDLSASTVTAFADWLKTKSIDGQFTDLYGCCDRTKRYSSKNALAAWQTEMRSFAAILGYAGPVHGFDTAIIKPADGTYVEYQLQVGGSQPARIFYKRSEKTEAVGGSLTIKGSDGDMAAWSGRQMRKQFFPKAGICGKESTFHSGVFHEVNYALRLDTFKI